MNEKKYIKIEWSYSLCGYVGIDENGNREFLPWMPTAKDIYLYYNKLSDNFQ